MLAALRRGLLAGAVGGLLAGAFGFVLARPLMDRAVEIESARSAAAGEVGEETFSRTAQHVGYFVATLAVGLALGVLYGVVHRLLHRDHDGDHGGDHDGGSDRSWTSAVQLGLAGFFAIGLVPFLRYPANPPGTGDSDTIGTRTNLWLSCLVIGLVGACVAGLVARGLRERGVVAPLRQLAVVGVGAATIALTFVLPDNTDEIAVPVSLVWDFRVVSLASTVLLWGGLAATFGLLGERAARRTA